jgi:hypothetical protein
MPVPGLLVLSDGCVGGLLAMAVATRDRDRPVYHWMPDTGPFAAARAAAARRGAELYQVREATAPGEAVSALDVLSGVLLKAGAIAAAVGASEIVWPVNAPEGPDSLERASANLQRAVLVSGLMRLEYGGIEIAAPYADFSDGELADLVLDMDLPIWTCWWFDPGELQGEAAEAAAAMRERWTALLQEAGWRGPLPAGHAAGSGVC